MEKIRLDRTNRKGYAAFWESGGGYSNTGESAIICDRHGQAKKAVYIRRRGHLANDRHALILINRGDFIIQAWHHREDFLIKIFQVKDFEREVDYYSDGTEIVKVYAIAEEKFVFDRGEWDRDLPEYLEAAVNAAIEKATCYHCREPHFIDFDA